jgi:hypothetical protein
LENRSAEIEKVFFSGFQLNIRHGLSNVRNAWYLFSDLLIRQIFLLAVGHS